MAILKSVNIKSLEYIFQAFENNKSDNPAKVIFKRFPLVDEIFPMANKKNILESKIFKEFDNTNNSKEQLLEYVINIIIENITANRIDYNRFIKECVSHIENLVYDEKEIHTIKDFLTLPQEAIFNIAQELYIYAKTEDKFEIEHKKKLK